MDIIQTQYPNKSYKQVISKILQNGQKVSPRGKGTIELQPVVHNVLEPQKRLCSVPGRKANPFFNMAENMWILGGHGEHEWVCSFNNKLKEYQLDEGFNDFNAPYGRRIRFANRHRSGQTHVQINPYNSVDIRRMPIVDQLFHCYMSLKKDQFSRQAVISLWNPVFDYFMSETKDRPCNTTIYFKIRDNKLCMTVCNRSNDVHLGLYGVNFVQFSHIQEFLAASLNIEIGHYIHLSDSLHIYDDSEITNRILESKYEFDVYDYVEPYILTFNEIKRTYEKFGDNDVNLGSFLIIADEVYSESLKFRESNLDINYKFSFCKSNYARGCAEFLFAYDFYKAGKYNESINMLEKSYNRGFKDWVICGLEFINRSEKFKEFLETNGADIDMFILPKFDINQAKSILHYIHNH